MTETRFDMGARDAHDQPIGVGDTVRRYIDLRRERYEERQLGGWYFVVSINEEPVFGRFISTADGPEQLVHSRIRIQDEWLYGGEEVVLAESVVVTKRAETAEEREARLFDEDRERTDEAWRRECTGIDDDTWKGRTR